jgi:hypothetical protein
MKETSNSREDINQERSMSDMADKAMKNQVDGLLDILPGGNALQRRSRQPDERAGG